jgi:hypothetical protein
MELSEYKMYLQRSCKMAQRRLNFDGFISQHAFVRPSVYVKILKRKLLVKRSRRFLPAVHAVNGNIDVSFFPVVVFEYDTAIFLHLKVLDLAANAVCKHINHEQRPAHLFSLCFYLSNSRSAFKFAICLDCFLLLLGLEFEICFPVLA